MTPLENTWALREVYFDNNGEPTMHREPINRPVAWLRKNGFRFSVEIEPQDDSELPLYTSPPKREWVGLTYEERMNIINRLTGQDWVYAVDAIEAKLKEKNT